ncbi:MAG: HepT-like ribonuclease domain-containing protein [Patescibacteria group bacterium]|mgnify:CR=1 FL=1
MQTKEITQELSDYFKKRDDVAFAYLFGSMVKGTTHSESDVDIGIYFTPRTSELEYESKSEYPGESEIWREVEKITKRETDLVVLNRAPATIAFAVLHEGQLLSLNYPSLWTGFYLTISEVAESFRAFSFNFMQIRERSHSLSEIDRNRLVRLLTFLDHELADVKKFQNLDQLAYQNEVDRTLKRNVERWAETLVNASIDCAKIILASEKKMIPETYREVLENLTQINNFDQKIASQLGEFAKLRNTLAHEYLDLRFAQLQKFVLGAEPVYRYLVEFIRNFIKK